MTTGAEPGTPARDGLVAGLASLIGARQPGHVLRVAVDGPDASGKTALADALADELARQQAGGRRGRPVIRAGIDGFHRQPSATGGATCPASGCTRPPPPRRPPPTSSSTTPTPASPRIRAWPAGEPTS
ncbi:MAG TPA: hypothetical protein VMV17_01090 [Streptosporangiaceae bacterium]|nr:hypothetical protein [Streptosporangiaceae bacterium]